MTGGRGRRHRAARAALALPLTALRETAASRQLVAVQLSWAAVNLATWTATVALTVAAFGLGGAGAVAAAVVARTLPSALLGPLLTAATRGWPRLRVLAVTAAATGLAGLGSAAATRSLPALLALGLLLASTTMVFRAVQSAVVPELADGPRRVASVNALSGGIEALGVFAGPALAGAGISLGGAPLAFGLAGVSGLAGAVALVPALRGRATPGSPPEGPARDRPPGPAPGPGPAPAPAPAPAPGLPPVTSRAEPSPGLLAPVRLPAVRLVLLLLVAQTVGSGGVTVLYPSLAADAYDLGPAGVGTLTAAFGLGGVAGALALFTLAGSRRLGVLTAVALGLWALPLLGLAAIDTPTPALALLVVVGVGNVLFDMTTVTLLQRAAPPALLTAAFVGLEVAVVLGSSAGAALVGVATAGLGPTPVLLALGALLLVVTGTAVGPLRQLDRTLAAPTEQVALLRGLPAFALLPTPAVERLALRLRRATVPPGEVVVRQGEPASTYWLVGDGALTVDVDGREVVGLVRGDAFGEIALLRDVPRTATVRARRACVLWALDREPFLETMRYGGSLRLLRGVADARLGRAAPAEPGTDGPA